MRDMGDMGDLLQLTRGKWQMPKIKSEYREVPHVPQVPQTLFAHETERRRRDDETSPALLCVAT
jgi:hypothetical protein